MNCGIVNGWSEVIDCEWGRRQLNQLIFLGSVAILYEAIYLIWVNLPIDLSIVIYLIYL